MNEYIGKNELDRLNAGWAEVERQLAGMSVSKDGLPLSMKVVASGSGAVRTRLFYRDKHILECSAEDRVAAVDYLPAFYEAYKARLKLLTEGAGRAADFLEKWLEDPKRTK